MRNVLALVTVYIAAMCVAVGLVLMVRVHKQQRSITVPSAPSPQIEAVRMTPRPGPLQVGDLAIGQQAWCPQCLSYGRDNRLVVDADSEVSRELEYRIAPVLLKRLSSDAFEARICPGYDPVYVASVDTFIGHPRHRPIVSLKADLPAADCSTQKWLREAR